VCTRDGGLGLTTIEEHDLVATRNEDARNRRADFARSTDDQDSHSEPPWTINTQF